MQTEGAQSAAAGPRNVSQSGPQRTARILLLAVSLGLCDQTYWLYSSVDRYQRGYWKTFIDGAGLAPEQYRIGVKLAAWWMVEHLRCGFRHGFALMDVIGTLLAVYLLYALLERRDRVRAAGVELRWFASAAFVALTCFYFAWVGFYFRPETLPTVGLTALMLWLWTAWRWPGWDRRRVWIALGLMAVSFVQAWIRADVPVALNAGMFLACLIAKPQGRAMRRPGMLATSLVCAGIASATQLYIMHVKYPHTSYGPIPIVMVRHDLHQPLSFPPFVFFMLPVAWMLVQFWRDRARRLADETDLGLVIGSVLYLVLWVILGKVDEVRIFIPFAMALAPLTIDLALRRIARDVGQNASDTLCPGGSA